MAWSPDPHALRGRRDRGCRRASRSAPGAASRGADPDEPRHDPSPPPAPRRQARRPARRGHGRQGGRESPRLPTSRSPSRLATSGAPSSRSHRIHRRRRLPARHLAIHHGDPRARPRGRSRRRSLTGQSQSRAQAARNRGARMLGTARRTVETSSATSVGAPGTADVNSARRLNPAHRASLGESNSNPVSNSLPSRRSMRCHAQRATRYAGRTSTARSTMIAPSDRVFSGRCIRREGCSRYASHEVRSFSGFRAMTEGISASRTARDCRNW
jgi:hypothetical protein